MRIDKSWRCVSGVYQIRNLYNNMVYVGQAKDFYARKQGHLTKMKNKRHHNDNLIFAFEKYGVDSFVFEVLQVVEDKEERDKVEKFWKEYYEQYDMTYNKSNSTKVVELTHYAKVLKISPYNGKVVEIYNSCEHAARENNTHATQIGGSCLPHTQMVTANGYIFRYTDDTDYKNGDIYFSDEELFKIMYYTNTNGTNSRSFPIAQYDADTMELLNVFKCSAEAVNLVGVNSGYLSTTLNGGYMRKNGIFKKATLCGGFKWKKIDLDEYLELSKPYVHYEIKKATGPKRIEMVCKETEETICVFDSQTQCAKVHGINTKTLNRWVKNKSKQPKTCPYIFKYAEE